MKSLPETAFQQYGGWLIALVVTNGIITIFLKIPLPFYGILFRCLLLVLGSLCVSKHLLQKHFSNGLLGNFLPSGRLPYPTHSILFLNYLWISLIWILSPGLLMILFLVGLVFCRLQHTQDSFLTNLFTYNFLFRAMLAVLILNSAILWNIKEVADYYQSPLIPFFGDATYYSLRGFQLAKFHWGTLTNYTRMIQWHEYGDGLYIHLIGWFYYVFGYCPEAIALLNCLLGALFPFILYKITAELAPIQTARTVALLTSIWTSLLVISIVTLKDLWVISSFTLTFLFWLYFMRSFNPLYVIFILFALLLTTAFRHDFSIAFLIGLVLVSSWVALPIKSYKKYGLLGFALVLLVISDPFQHKLKLLYVKHMLYVNSGGESYKILPNQYYDYLRKLPEHTLSFQEHIQIISKGVYHLLVEPKPWGTWTLKTWLFLPQTLLWFLLLSLSIYGLYDFLCHRYGPSLFVYFLPLCLGLAISSGNIGTMIRHRDILTPLFLIMGAFGWTKLYNKVLR